MDKQEKFNYEDLKRKTLEQLRSGRSLFGKDGAFAPLLSKPPSNPLKFRKFFPVLRK
jgi:hypothetical protein